MANPRKSTQVAEILVRNKLKLIDFLRKFNKDKEDETFNEEKQTLIKTLEQLQPPAGSDVVPAALDEQSSLHGRDHSLNLTNHSLPLSQSSSLVSSSSAMSVEEKSALGSK